MALSGPPGAAEARASAPTPDARRPFSRVWVFVLVVSACFVVAASYVAWSAMRSGSAERTIASGPVAAGPGETGAPAGASGDSGGPVAPESDGARIALANGGPGTLLFQSLVPGEYWSRVGLTPLGGPQWPRSMAPLGCTRIHYAANRGLCLAEDGGALTLDEGVFATHAAYVFGPDFLVQHEISLNGLPSRTRVSPDGRYGAITTFVAGHSYAVAGFSTETILIDLASGAKLGNLEEFTVFRDGNRFHAVDFNFWGMTFSQDSNRFYATLNSSGQTYLVQGDIGGRQMQVLRENVECPSLSPDGRRLAFKKRVGGDLGAVVWRFHVLDLTTMEETPLAESRSIDDQIEWLDDEQVLYGDGSDVWVMSADGSGQPRRFMSAAASPTVVRTASVDSGGANEAEVETLTLPAVDLDVAVSTAPERARVNEELTYTLTVTNRGTTTATDLLVEQILPEGLDFGEVRTVSLNSGGYGCSSAYPVEVRVTCDTMVLPSGESWTIALTVTPKAAGTIEYRATAYAIEPDANPRNDSVTTKVAVSGDG